MGIQGLFSYISRVPTSRQRVDLSHVAPEIHRRTGERANLLCDYFTVVQWLLGSFENSQIQHGKLSPYSVMYGGSLPESGKRVVCFVLALEKIGITPVFFIAGPPGSDNCNFSDRLSELRLQHCQQLEQCNAIHQVCTQTQSLSQLRRILREDVVTQVELVLKSAGVKLVYCSGESSTSILGYLRAHTDKVCGVLSTDTVFAVASKSKLYHPSFFDLEHHLGIYTESICEMPSGLVCDVVTPASLANSLGIREQQLADLAVLCGNRFSSKHNSQYLPCKELAFANCRVESVAKWLQLQEEPTVPLLSSQHMQAFFCCHPVYNKVFADTYSLYHGDIDPDLDPLAGNSNNSIDLQDECSALGLIQQRAKNDLFSQKLLSIANGIHWRVLFPEAVLLNQLSFSDLTLSLRRKLYTLMGLKKVKEFGRSSSKSFDEVNVELQPGGFGTHKLLASLNELDTNGKLVALFYFVSSHQEDLESADKVAHILAQSSKEGSFLEGKVLSGKAILFCASYLFLITADSRAKPSPGVKIGEFDALLATSLACCANLPPCHIPVLPPARAITVGMLFAHIIQQVYLFASFVGLSAELPPPAEVFYPLPYVAFHMVCFIMEEDCQLQSPYLTDTHRIFSRMFEMSSVLALSAEFFNHWESLNLFRILVEFEAAVKEVEHSRDILTPPKLELEGLDMSFECVEAKNKEDEGSTPLDDAGDDFNMEGSYRGEIMDVESVAQMECDHHHESDNSDIILQDSTELPTSEEYLVSEENLYLTMQHTDQQQSSSLTEFIVNSLSHKESIAETDAESEIDDGEEEVEETEEEGLPSGIRIIPPKEQHKIHKLPIMEHRTKILELIQSHMVVCIEGETGCGKSTKVPQFIIDDAMSCTPPKVIVTQPRRVAAMKLAERVAQERGERLGKTVSYRVGGGDSHHFPSTALTYCTTGYLLQCLIHKPEKLSHYTHIVLDEIHERSIDADFIMLVIRRLSTTFSNIKIIIMSATMQGELLTNYFMETIPFRSIADPYFVGVRRYPVDTFFLDQISFLAARERKFWHQSQFKAAAGLKQLAINQPKHHLPSLIKARPELTQYTQDVCTEVIISQANLGESILVFLPGISEISSYHERLTGEVEGRGLKDFFSLFVLHSQIPLEDQQEAFRPPPSEKVHVILATNIAESSLTLPKLRMVVDFAIYRQLQYMGKRRISCLVKKWCSHASCSQRAGRAGRVFEGVAIHLVTKQFYDVVMSEYDQPEIQSAPISKLILQAKQIGSKLGISLPSKLLGLAIEPPSLQQMEAALEDLASLGAIVSEPEEEVSEEADITLLGYFSLSLPVDLVLSRLVLYGLLFGCPVDAIVMAASMSLSQDVFSLPSRVIIKKDSAFRESLRSSMRSRFDFDSGAYSDPKAVCTMFRVWIDFCNSEDVQLGRVTLARRFARRHPVRWERLLHLESQVSDLASRVLARLPKDTPFHGDIEVLASLSRSKLSWKKGDGKPNHSGSVEFCNDNNVLRALLTAAFFHQMIIGYARCGRSHKEALKVQREIATVTNTGLDCRRTLVMRLLKSPSEDHIAKMTEIILPGCSCKVAVVKDSGFIQVIAPRSEMTEFLEFHRDKSVVASQLSSEVFFLWQFGERRPLWSVEGVSSEFTKPQHSLGVVWQRLSRDTEKVMVSSWRYPTGLVCELEKNCPPFYLAVASSLQGTGHCPFITANGVTVLPSLHHSPLSLLFLLAFQPLHSDFCLLTDSTTEQIVGIRTNYQELHFSSSNPDCLFPITREDLFSINALRYVLSDVLKSTDPSGELPTDMSLISSLLRVMIEQSYNRPPKQGLLVCVESTVWEPQEPGMFVPPSSPHDGSGCDDCSCSPSFHYYPPLKSCLLESESLEQQCLPSKPSMPTGAGEFSAFSRLSPFAKPFFPSGQQPTRTDSPRKSGSPAGSNLPSPKQPEGANVAPFPMLAGWDRSSQYRDFAAPSFLQDEVFLQMAAYCCYALMHGDYQNALLPPLQLNFLEQFYSHMRRQQALQQLHAPPPASERESPGKEHSSSPLATPTSPSPAIPVSVSTASSLSSSSTSSLPPSLPLPTSHSFLQPKDVVSSPSPSSQLSPVCDSRPPLINSSPSSQPSPVCDSRPPLINSRPSSQPSPQVCDSRPPLINSSLSSQPSPPVCDSRPPLINSSPSSRLSPACGSRPPLINSRPALVGQPPPTTAHFSAGAPLTFSSPIPPPTLVWPSTPPPPPPPPPPPLPPLLPSPTYRFPTTLPTYYQPCQPCLPGRATYTPARPPLLHGGGLSCGLYGTRPYKQPYNQLPPFSSRYNPNPMLHMYSGLYPSQPRPPFIPRPTTQKRGKVERVNRQPPIVSRFSSVSSSLTSKQESVSSPSLHSDDTQKVKETSKMPRGDQPAAFLEPVAISKGSLPQGESSQSNREEVLSETGQVTTEPAESSDSCGKTDRDKNEDDSQLPVTVGKFGHSDNESICSHNSSVLVTLREDRAVARSCSPPLCSISGRKMVRRASYDRPALAAHPLTNFVRDISQSNKELQRSSLCQEKPLYSTVVAGDRQWRSTPDLTNKDKAHGPHFVTLPSHQSVVSYSRAVTSMTSLVTQVTQASQARSLEWKKTRDSPTPQDGSDSRASVCSLHSNYSPFSDGESDWDASSSCYYPEIENSSDDGEPDTGIKQKENQVEEGVKSKPKQGEVPALGYGQQVPLSPPTECQSGSVWESEEKPEKGEYLDSGTVAGEGGGSSGDHNVPTDDSVVWKSPDQSAHSSNQPCPTTVSSSKYGSDEHMLRYFKEVICFYRARSPRIADLSKRYENNFHCTLLVKDLKAFFMKHPDVFTVKKGFVMLTESQSSQIGTSSAQNDHSSVDELSKVTDKNTELKTVKETAALSPRSKASLISLSLAGTKRLEDEVTHFLYSRGRIMFLSDLLKNRKLLMLSQVCGTAMNHSFFLSRPHLFQVQERESFWEEFSDDFQIVLQASCARQIAEREADEAASSGGGARGQLKQCDEEEVRGGDKAGEREGGEGKQRAKKGRRKRGQFSRDKFSRDRDSVRIVWSAPAHGYRGRESEQTNRPRSSGPYGYYSGRRDT